MRSFKLYTLIGLIYFGLTNSSLAANYYFSSSLGNDSFTSIQAQNSSTPWKSIDKLNLFFGNLLPGDTVFFKKGDVFVGSIKMTQSGTVGNSIVFSAYGTGTPPIISGLETLSTWNDLGGGIWESNCMSCGTRANLLLINDVDKEMGRYPNSSAPNKGYLTFESHIAKTQITDNDLLASPNWTGATLVLRANHWIIDRDLITNHSGTSISYSTLSPYEPIDYFGYFIQNHIATLDVDGEWFYDTLTSKMNCFFGTNLPTAYTVETSVVDTLVVINGQHDISIENLTFRGANITSIYLFNAQNISIRNSTLKYSGYNGVEAAVVSGLAFENNNVLNIHNNALQFIPLCSNSSARNNLIKNTAIYPGMGASFDNAYNAIIFEGDSNVIEYNEIDSTGYLPIQFEGNNVLVKNNFIHNFCFTKDDGSGIYSWEGNSTAVHKQRTIVGNIVDNGIGASEGTDNSDSKLAYGIYMDDNTDHVEILDNSISNCSAGGFFNHNSNNITFKNNSVFSCGTQMIFGLDGLGCTSCPSGSNLVKNNILFSKKPEQLVLNLWSLTDIVNLNAFDSNYYCRPAMDSMIIQNEYTPTGSTISVFETLDLQDWKSIYSEDFATQTAPVSFPYYAVNNIISSNKVTNGTFDTDVSGHTCFSPFASCNISWSNGGQLDGGAAEFSFISVSGQQNLSHFEINVGSIDSSKNYILRFSLMGTKNNRNLDAYLRQSLAPYAALSRIQSFKVRNSRTEIELLISKPKSSTNTTLDILIDEQDSTVWIDNIELFEADVTIENLDDYIRYEYNATQNPTTFTLLTPYIDVEGNLYSGTVTLQPFTSIVLMNAQLIEVNDHTITIEADVKIYPNPFVNNASIRIASLFEDKPVTYTLYDILGRVITQNVFNMNTDTDIYPITLNGNTLSVGIYILKIDQNNNQRTFKLIKKE